MKKFESLCLCLWGMISLMLVSCGGDDNGSYNVGSLLIETEDGDKLLVTSVGSLKYGYDDDGVLNYFYDYDDYDVTDNGTTFSYTDSYGSETIKLTLNGSGYISKIVEEGTYEWRDESETWKETCNLSYDGSGHLTKLSASYSETYIEDDEKETYSGSGSWTLTWSNGMLTKWVYYESDEEWEYTDTYEYDYGSNTYANSYCQYAPAVWDESDAILAELSYIGLLGVGPTYLPSTVDYTSVEEGDGDVDSYDGSSSYKFSFNSNGTISYQTNAKGTGKKSFTYEEYTGSVTRAFDIEIEEEEDLDADGESARRRSLLGRRHLR